MLVELRWWILKLFSFEWNTVLQVWLYRLPMIPKKDFGRSVMDCSGDLETTPTLLLPLICYHSPPSPCNSRSAPHTISLTASLSWDNHILQVQGYRTKTEPSINTSNLFKSQNIFIYLRIIKVVIIIMW